MMKLFRNYEIKWKKSWKKTYTWQTLIKEDQNMEKFTLSTGKMNKNKVLQN